MMNETLAVFIRRIRLEKSASQLLSNPQKTVTEVALDCGFSSSSVFARNFKSHFKMSAQQWRQHYRKNGQVDRKDSQTERKDCKDRVELTSYDYGVVTETRAERSENRVIIPVIRRINSMKFTDLKVEVRDLKEMNVAYVRHVGPYAGDDELFRGLFEKLMRWAGPRGLLQQPDLDTVIVYHDNPEVTDQSRLRTSVCISVPLGTEVTGEIGLMSVPSGKYACGHFELSANEYPDAWNAMCGQWLPDSGWQPDDRPCFERCLNNPEEHPDHKHIIEICIPVKPL